MKDLLTQALDGLTPQSRAEINFALAQIQNGRNLRHNKLCSIPSADLGDALIHHAESELRGTAALWDIEIAVKGLA